MQSKKTKRISRSYSPTGKMTRAALDFVEKWGFYSNFGSDFNALPHNEQHEKVIEMFENRQVVTAEFSMLIPESEGCIQNFVVTFAPQANGYSPVAKVNVESVAELRDQAKLYKADASAYSQIRKPRRRKVRPLDNAL